MAQMQTLKVDFSEVPDALPVQRKTLHVDFSDIPDAVPQGHPEQSPQLPEDTSCGKKILRVDFSDIPDALPKAQTEQTSQLPVNPLTGKKISRVDFSDIPDAPPVERIILRVDFSDLPDAEPSAVAPADQITVKHGPTGERQGPKDWFWDNPLVESLFGQRRVNTARDYLEKPLPQSAYQVDWSQMSDPFAEVPTPNVFQSAARLAVGIARSPGDLAKSIVSPSPDGGQTDYSQMSDPLAEMPAAPFVKETVKGIAEFTGKPAGIYGWDEFVKAWAERPAESVAGIMPLIGAFFKMKGLAEPTPADASRFVQKVVEHPEENVAKEFAEGFTKEIEHGPSKGELDFFEGSGDAAKSGAAPGILGSGPEGAWEAKNTAARSNFNVYEALSEQQVTGLSRSAHSVSANRALYGQLQSSPELAQMFDEQLGGDVLAHMESGSGRNLLNPPGTVWHHPINNHNVLQLLRTTEHTNPLLQPLLHPGGTGGYVNFYGN